MGKGKPKLGTGGDRPPIPTGFVAGGVASGIKGSGKLDLGAILCEGPAVAAGLFTTNRFAAAPVELCRKRLTGIGRQIRGIVVNSGNANAMTGPEGDADALAVVQAMEQSTGAAVGSFLAASTGVIGQRLPADRIVAAAPKLAAKLSPDGWDDFADSIMTTDTVRKMAWRTIEIGDEKSTILGIAKGAAMIHPNMATMLAFVVTDAPLPAGKSRQMLRVVCEETFNSISVDGQTSTNDSIFILGSRLLPRKHYVPPELYEAFGAGLHGVCEDLAKAIVRDGEGATKTIEVVVRGSNTHEQSRRLAREIANSVLVKAAIHGGDPNWGRVVQALGQAGIPFRSSEVDIAIQGVPVLSRGEVAKFDRPGLAGKLATETVSIEVSVGTGKGFGRMWTCDLSPEYVKLNMEYT